MKVDSNDIRKIISSNESVDSLRYVIPNECIYMIEKKGFYKTKIHQDK